MSHWSTRPVLAAEESRIRQRSVQLRVVQKIGPISRESFPAKTSFDHLRHRGVLGAIGLGIEAFVSPEAASRFTSGSPWLSVPVAAALGTPLYFSTELFVPIANSLENAGVGVGAIVALTISGAGANVPEFVLLSKLAKPGAVGVFFGYVFGVAVVGGALAHLIAG